MDESMKQPADLTRLNTVQPQMAKAEITLNRVDLSADTAADAAMLSLIDKALRRSGAKQEYVSALANVKPSQLSGALNGHGGFNARWLDAFPPEFWSEFIPLLRAAKEPTEESRRLRRRELLITTITLLLAEVA